MPMFTKHAMEQPDAWNVEMCLNCGIIQNRGPEPLAMNCTHCGNVHFVPVPGIHEIMLAASLPLVEAVPFGEGQVTKAVVATSVADVPDADDLFADGEKPRGKPKK